MLAGQDTLRVISRDGHPAISEIPEWGSLEGRVHLLESRRSIDPRSKAFRSRIDVQLRK